jgi:hypothetical protein
LPNIVSRSFESFNSLIDGGSGGEYLRTEGREDGEDYGLEEPEDEDDGYIDLNSLPLEQQQYYLQ